MRIGHSGDWHTTVGPRWETQLLVLGYVADDGMRQGVHLWTVGGDLAGTTVPHKAEPAERNANARTLQMMAAHAPVVVIEGNHEYPGDLEIYGRLAGRYPIHAVTQPDVLELDTAAGPVRVYCLPYPSKRWLVGAGSGGAVADQKVEMETHLRTLLTAWRLDAADWRARGVPTVLLFHGNVGGSVTGGGEVMLGREIELAPHDLDELGVDVALCSHIHKFQQVGVRGWFAGSPTAQNHGEPDVKGYLLADVVAGQPPVVTFRPTPARRLLTVDVDLHPGPSLIEQLDAGGDRWQGIAGAEVRVRARYHEEEADSVPSTALLTSWAIDSCGAAAVVVERTPIPRTRSRLTGVQVAVAGDGDTPPAMGAGDDTLRTPPPATVDASVAWSTAGDPAEKLRLFWQLLGARAPDAGQQARCLRKLETLQAGGS